MRDAGCAYQSRPLTTHHCPLEPSQDRQGEPSQEPSQGTFPGQAMRPPLRRGAEYCPHCLSSISCNSSPFFRRPSATHFPCIRQKAGWAQRAAAAAKIAANRPSRRPPLPPRSSARGQIMPVLFCSCGYGCPFLRFLFCGSNHACPFLLLFLLLRLCLSFFAVPLAAVLGAVGGPIAGCPFRCAAGSGNLTGSFAIRVSLPWVQPHDWLRTERWRQPAGVSPRGEIGPPAPRL